MAVTYVLSSPRGKSFFCESHVVILLVVVTSLSFLFVEVAQSILVVLLELFESSLVGCHD